MTKYHVGRLDASDPAAERAVAYLSEKGEGVVEYIVHEIPARPGEFRWNAMRVLDARGALGRPELTETLVLNYRLLKFIADSGDAKGDVLERAVAAVLGDSCSVTPYFYENAGDMVGPDNLDHEWVLGVSGVVFRDAGGVKSIVRSAP